MPIEPPTLTELLWNPQIWGFWLVVVFVFGTIVGSFLNVCIYRVPLGLSVNKPSRSFCFRCGTGIAWYDNVPVLSYFVLGGRCRSCGASYSMRYAMVELLTGLLFAAVFWTANPTTEAPFQFATIWYLAFTAMLVVGTFTDLDHWIIPDGVSIWGGVAAVAAAVGIGFLDGDSLLARFGPFPAVRVYWEDGWAEVLLAILGGTAVSWRDPAVALWWEPVANSLAGVAVGVGLLWMIQVTARTVMGKEAMGSGDVKLFALIGGTLGAYGSVLTLFAACLLGATVGFVLTRVFALWSTPPDVLALGKPAAPAADAEAQPDTEHGALLRALASRPTEHSVHHLPFGPWIAAGALVVLLTHRHVQGWLF